MTADSRDRRAQQTLSGMGPVDSLASKRNHVVDGVLLPTPKSPSQRKFFRFGKVFSGFLSPGRENLTMPTVNPYA
jgi:hypothetical protein